MAIYQYQYDTGVHTVEDGEALQYDEHWIDLFRQLFRWLTEGKNTF